MVFKLAKRNALQKGKYNLQNNKRVVKDGCCLWLLLPPNKKTLLLPSSPQKNAMKENSTQFYHSTEENSHSLKLHCPSQGTLDRLVTFGMNGSGGQKCFFFSASSSAILMQKPYLKFFLNRTSHSR